MAAFFAKRNNSPPDATTVLLLLFGLLMSSLDITGAQTGVCYGGQALGNNLPSPQEAVDLYKSSNIHRMRLYAPDEATLEVLRDSNIELILGVPNDDLQGIAINTTTAYNWVQRNIKAYSSNVKFKYIAVGNEVNLTTNGEAQFVLPAMQNIQSAITSFGLQNQIKVSTAIDSQLLDDNITYPPSQLDFKGEARSFIDPIISFLVNNGAPLLANVYPYFIYKYNQQDIQLSYALFTSSSVVVQDGGLGYQNLFDAMVDAFYSALEKDGGGSVEIVVSESGWPTEGDVGTSVQNAQTYNSKLIEHVKNGTPKRQGRAIETYIFEMFDENLKNPEREKHWGLFFPNKQPKYQFSFS
ncbi:glucan endo-1,3-beta-glucosidase, basic vacuolar isoform-like [Macadamia integrifolia]|uniref:glucan endo-1,3-beta-glucosidase, basic vacuolar isoform-like n=1 Tax=Macadamia integrifolia TaxID=60698 RepID=UPI001C4EE9D4|nr:glucan endo-1,3-beta-glucosidase, basic vacuolar isoform-like [Macadamia integrifolia]